MTVQPSLFDALDEPVALVDERVDQWIDGPPATTTSHTPRAASDDDPAFTHATSHLEPSHLEPSSHDTSSHDTSSHDTSEVEHDARMTQDPPHRSSRRRTNDDRPEKPAKKRATRPEIREDDTPASFIVEVVRSKRRKRTVGAQMLGGVLRVTVPSWMSRAEEQEWVREMTRRYERAHRVGRIDLTVRAASLARRFGLPRPVSVRWGGDMRTQWGSCTPVDRTIRLADRLAEMPPWVLDYVLVHEMAHIVEPNHSPAFWELVNRYEKAERAIGYLLAKSMDPVDAPDHLDDDTEY